jgi:O-antigen/teichoic acid export membrane protein
MEILNNSNSLQKELKAYVGDLKKERNIFIICRVILTILLCGFLVLAFLLFIFNYNLFSDGHFRLNEEGCRLLWIAVAMAFFCLLWIVVKSSLRLKQYRKNIRKLEMLLLRVKIQSKGTEEEICEVLRSYYGTRCESRTHNESNTTDKH